jgi:hypothetical protein
MQREEEGSVSGYHLGGIVVVVVVVVVVVALPSSTAMVPKVVASVEVVALPLN